VIEEMNLTFNSEDVSFIYDVAVLENVVWWLEIILLQCSEL
jgi:hypothetical protein